LVLKRHKALDLLCKAPDIPPEQQLAAWLTFTVNNLTCLIDAGVLLGRDWNCCAQSI